VEAPASGQASKAERVLGEQCYMPPPDHAAAKRRPTITVDSHPASPPPRRQDPSSADDLHAVEIFDMQASGVRTHDGLTGNPYCVIFARYDALSTAVRFNERSPRWPGVVGELGLAQPGELAAHSSAMQRVDPLLLHVELCHMSFDGQEEKLAAGSVSLRHLAHEPGAQSVSLTLGGVEAAADVEVRFAVRIVPRAPAQQAAPPPVARSASATHRSLAQQWHGAPRSEQALRSRPPA
jgi:hypothetical protein